MKKSILSYITMAFVAMVFVFSQKSFAADQKQKLFLKTVDTSQELRSRPNPFYKESHQGKKGSINKQKSFKSSLVGQSNSRRSLSSLSETRLQRHGLGLGIGQTFLLGQFSDYGNSGITLDAFYTYTASYSFDLLVNGHFSYHKREEERMQLSGLSASIKGRVVEYDNLAPYLLTGLGFYLPKAKREINGSTEWTQSKVTFGLNLGGGIDLQLNDHYILGLLGQMHWPFKIAQDHQADLKGTYFKLLITGMYLF